jgi:hypothetical protein
MSKKILFFAVSIVLVISAAAAGFFALGGMDLLKNQKTQEIHRTKVIIPGEADIHSRTQAEEQAYTEKLTARAPMGEGETVVSILNYDFDGDAAEEQFIAFRLAEPESPIYAAYIEYDEKARSNRRTWTAPIAAAKPGTISLFTMDLIGDRSVCVLVTGMNNQDEHTMTVFKWNKSPRQRRIPDGPPFVKIAEIQIEGSIKVQEAERSQAYQLGLSNGQSFTIAAYGHDIESANLLDQIEITYGYNPGGGLYEKTKVTRIPGYQVEQRRLRELLSGSPGVFEKFINDLWYYVSPQGTLDNRQYIYFDPVNRELIFFGDETQQIFAWQNSTPTRYGLYIASQNISVTTLRRKMDIELESLDSIKVKVFEDVHLKIGVSATWDGSYRRAGTARKNSSPGENSIQPYIDAVYDSSMGRLRFYSGGAYELSSGNTMKKGSYVFFQINNQELLELRPDTGNIREAKSEDSRMVYRIDKTRKDSPGNSPEILALTRIRLGAAGIQDLHEGAVILTPAEG